MSAIVTPDANTARRLRGLLIQKTQIEREEKAIKAAFKNAAKGNPEDKITLIDEKDIIVTITRSLYPTVDTEALKADGLYEKYSKATVRETVNVK